LEQCNTIINKKFVFLEELDKVVALAGEKVESKLGEIARDFTEAMEIKEAHHVELEEKIANLTSHLETQHTTNVLLASLVTSLPGQVGELEDVIMGEEESDADGDVVVSSDLSSLTDVEPMENMVAIPVPTPLISTPWF
jgi:hypothetical protein